MVHQASFPVQQLRSAIDNSSVNLANGLMAEADAENWHLASKQPDHVHAHARVGGGARAGGYQHAVIVSARFRRDGIIALDLDLGTKLGEVLNKVEDERIVIIDDQDSSAHKNIIPQRG